MADNLLINSGFEMPWGIEDGGDSSHRCFVYTPNGIFLREEEIGNVFTPSGGWITWFVHEPGSWDQPEVRDAWKQHDERRAHSGEKGIVMFSFCRRHWGGFLQQVQVEPGTRLRLSAWAHAWSNHTFGHADNPWWSEGAEWAPWLDEGPHGDDEEWQVQNWHLLGTPGLSDEWRNITFRVGIDPAGGSNPFAGTLVWSDGLHQYNEYGVPIPAIEVTAQASTVTVFLASTTRWPFKHNDAYWDDAELVMVGELGQAPIASFSYACDGLACEFDGSASHDPDGEVVAWDWDMGDGIYYRGNMSVISHIYAEAGNYYVTLTVADDDGLVDSVTQDVTVVEKPPGKCRGHPRIQYPRTVILLPPNSSWLWPTALSGVLEFYHVSIVYSADDAGIGDLDVRNVIAINPQLWPDDLGAFFEEYYPGVGYHPCVTDLENAEYAVGDVLEAILQPPNLPPYVDAGADQTVTLPDVASLDGTVMDDGLPDPPAVVTTAWSKVSGPGAVTFADAEAVDTTASFAEVGVYVLRLSADDGELMDYDEVTVTVQDAPPVEEPPWAGMVPISLHVQKPVADPSGYGDLEFVRDAQPSVYKTVGYMEQLERVKAVSPKTVTVYRQFVENQGEYIDLPDGPRRFLWTFLDSLNRLRDSVDLIEGINEIFVPNELAYLSDWYCYYAEAIAAEGSPAGPAVGSIPVGNPKLVIEGGQPLIEEMLPMVRAAIRYNGAVNYHGYHRVYNGVVDPAWDVNWLCYAARCMEDWDVVFQAHGLRPNYVISEAGAFLNALAGWKHDEVFNGNWDAYAQSLLELRDRIDAWNAANNYRCIGYTLFTYLPEGQGWRDYNLYGYARALAETLTPRPVGSPTVYTRIRQALSRVGLQDVGTDVANGKWVWTGQDPRERYMNGG